MSKRKDNNIYKTLITIIVAIILGITGYLNIEIPEDTSVLGKNQEISYASSFELNTIPAFEGNPYVIINNNIPEFKDEELVTESFEKYSPLDSLGRCGPAIANVGTETMPTEERGAISSVKPSGWQTTKYDIVEGRYLYNRCHLIGYQLTAENANKENDDLIKFSTAFLEEYFENM